MIRPALAGTLILGASGLLGQTSSQTPAPVTQPVAAPRPKFDTFDVATVKPTDLDKKSGRYILMDGDHRFIAKYETLKLLIAAAYDLNPRAISGGPAWVDSDHFDITAVTPGAVKPDRAEQMRMLRALLVDRFQLTFHREPKEFSIYELEVGKTGSKMKPSTLPPDAQPAVVTTVYSQKLVMPARNASMGDFTSVLQRAILDRPVVDKTGLTGRYDFNLEWAPDETQFGGEVGKASDEADASPFFKAVEEQLGLHLKPTHGMIQALVVDRAEKPSAN